MSPWKQLPDSLDPRARHLVVQLRRLKDHSGLGLQALASRTGYSRSSWDRYLNGRALPPRRAVAAFARACGVDEGRLLALHELAAAATDGTGRSARGEGPDQPRNPGQAGQVERVEQNGRSEQVEQVEQAERAAQAPKALKASKAGEPGEPENGDGRSGLRPWVTASVAAAVTALTALTALLVTTPWDSGEEQGDHVAVTGSSAMDPEQQPFVFQPGKDYPCWVHRDDDGLLYAGYSRTRTALIGKGSTQWPVVEAQCLLRHHGFPPGLADGIFGSGTERAVKRLQRDAHIVVDGVVGEDTWEVLRK